MEHVINNAAKYFLGGVWRRRRELNATLEAIATVRSSLYGAGTDYSKDRVEGGIKTDLSDKLNRLQKLRDQADRETDALIKMRDAADKLIDHLEDKDQRRVLRLRYVYEMPWPAVADTIHVTLRWAFKIHGRALAVLNTTCYEEIKEDIAVHFKHEI